jgi:hypothetical protein
MEITTKVKHNWVEITIIDGNTIIEYDIWKNELAEIKTMLQDAIDDIDHFIDKTQKD